MKRLQILHGTTVENNAFVGRIGELTVNTDDNSLRVHDGETAGGHAVGVKESALRKLFIDIAHPVGSWYASDDPTDPSELFEGTTWVRLTGKKGLIACDDNTPVGTEGGTASITMTEAQLPSHTHTQESCDTQGDHTHGRGTWNSTGSMTDRGNSSNHTFKSASKAFSVSGTASSWGIGTDGGVSGKAYPTINFTWSSGFSGTMETQGGHSHTVTLNETGSGESIDIMNPFYATYIWKRTA